jgi:hydroxymethylbilane synthase
VRLGLEARATDVLEPEVSLPAVGQGALGIECREEDDRTRAILARLHDEETGYCVEAERGVLVALEGDCKTPLAAHAIKKDGDIFLRAFVAEPDGSRYRADRTATHWPDDPEKARALGLELGHKLKAT